MLNILIVFFFSDGVKNAKEWDDGGAYALVDNGEPSVPVRALQDYEAAEQDELTFKSGNLETWQKLLALGQI